MGRSRVIFEAGLQLRESGTKEGMDMIDFELLSLVFPHPDSLHRRKEITAQSLAKIGGYF